MTNGVTAMWDDAEHYKELAEHFGVEVRRIKAGAWWPYNMDSRHYEELKVRWRKEHEVQNC